MTVAGVDIRVHATFLLLVLLVAIGSAGPEGPGVVSGLLWLAALFCCVVIHELAHSLVARRNGVPGIEIELLPIGGISRIAGPPEDPRVELRIAIAGPITSVVLGVAFAAVAVLAGASIWPPTLYGGRFPVRLAWVNLLLAGFNMVPALPLDGGRVLRAVLERRSDRARATRAAARAGRLLASMMIAAGFLWNLWLLVIGLFVYFGCAAEEAAATMHERVKNLRVRNVMIQEPVCVTTHMAVTRAVELLRRTAQRELPVVTAEGAYLGLVTARALLDADRDETVGDVMEVAAPTVRQEDLVEATGLLGGDLEAAAVLSGGRVVGLVRASDVVAVAQRLLQQAPGAH
ncbi:MAG: site-2 protease family protein [Actinomycetota bacterium]